MSWVEITKEEYFSKREGLKPIESFTDPEGMLAFGHGFPYMETIYGKDRDTPILKIETMRPSIHSSDWITTYFENR